MISFIVSKTEVAPFVADILTSSKCDWQSITITDRVKYGDCCVRIATDTLSEDTVKALGQIYLKQLTSI